MASGSPWPKKRGHSPEVGGAVSKSLKAKGEDVEDVLSVNLEPEEEDFFEAEKQALPAHTSLSGRLNRRSRPPEVSPQPEPVNRKRISLGPPQSATRAQDRLRARCQPPTAAPGDRPWVVQTPAAAPKLRPRITARISPAPSPAPVTWCPPEPGPQLLSANDARLAIHRRLNQRSRPPELLVKASRSARLDPRLSRPRPPEAPPEVLERFREKHPTLWVGQPHYVCRDDPSAYQIPRPNLGGWRFESRPPDPPPDPIRPAPEDPNRTPERPTTPTGIIMSEEAPDVGLHEASFSASLTFSPNASRLDLNASLASSHVGVESDSPTQGDLAPTGALPDLSTTLVHHIMAGQDVAALSEPMDWDEVDPGLLKALHDCRKEVKDTPPSTSNSLRLLSHRMKTKKVDTSCQSIDTLVMVVIDTNVYISNLERIREMLGDQAFKDKIQIFLPWTVLRELDILKSRRCTPELAQSAQTAILFLNKALREKRGKIRGQTVEDEQVASSLFSSENEDDRILQSCLRLRSEGFTVLLYTNDRNLANKGLVHDLETSSSSKASESLRRILWRLSCRSKSTKSESVQDIQLVHEMFREVWNHIHKSTWNYCRHLGLNFPSVEPAPADQFQFGSNAEIGLHLREMSLFVLRMSGVHTWLLSFTRDGVEDENEELARHVRKYAEYLNTFQRKLVPKSKMFNVIPSHAITAQDLMAFIKDPTMRDSFNSASQQLLDFSRSLEDCKEALM